MIVSDAVQAYIAKSRPEPDPVLAEMEQVAAAEGIPVVVPETGALLHVLTLAGGVGRVLEVGTAIGVSTLYLARGLPEDGVIVSFEIDEARHAAARSYLARAGVLGRVDLRLQDARDGIPSLKGSFDLVFIDGVKTQYGDYLDLVLPRLAPGSILVVDNVLMAGSVAEGRSDGHWSQEQIEYARGLNQRLLGDEQLAAVLTPVGDGVLVAVRR